VPYLSAAIKDYLDAPVPFFMGISKNDNPKTDCIIIDLDTGKLQIPEYLELPAAPAPFTTKLAKDLREVLQSSDPPNKKWLRVKNAF
jgi:hypothetical protein